MYMLVCMWWLVNYNLCTTWLYHSAWYIALCTLKGCHTRNISIHMYIPNTNTLQFPECAVLQHCIRHRLCSSAVHVAVVLSGGACRSTTDAVGAALLLVLVLQSWNCGSNLIIWWYHRHHVTTSSIVAKQEPGPDGDVLIYAVTVRGPVLVNATCVLLPTASCLLLPIASCLCQVVVEPSEAPQYTPVCSTHEILRLSPPTNPSSHQIYPHLYPYPGTSLTLYPYTTIVLFLPPP